MKEITGKSKHERKQNISQKNENWQWRKIITNKLNKLFSNTETKIAKKISNLQALFESYIQYRLV